MAKKKTTESVEEAVQETAQFPAPEKPTQTEAPETPVQEQPVPEKDGTDGTSPFKIKQWKTTVLAPVIETPSEIPSEVLAYFQNNPDEKAVYFDKTGGMYTASTPKVFLKDALLYHNPLN